MIRSRLLFFHLLSVIFFMGCSNNPLDIDTSDIEVKINFTNADSLFVNSSSSQRIELNRKYKNSFPDLYLFTFEKGLKIRTGVDTTFSNQMTEFYKDSYVKDLEKELRSSFSNLSKERQQLISAFKHIKHHFKQIHQPKNIVFFNSLFSYNAIATPSDIGVGLEWYLGSNNKVIKKTNVQGLFEYMKQGMERKFMVRDVVYQWIYAHVIPPTDSKFAEDMISWGKLLYCIEAAMPEEDKAIVCRYSPEKYKWAEENEKNIWKFLVEKKLLFESDELLKLGYFNEAPFTKGLPKESPDRLGQYMGWKMVRKYMESHSDLTLEKLIKIPYAEIMQAYK